MRFTQHLRARLTAVLTTSALVAGGLSVTALVAPAAVADVSPIVAPTSSMVTTDALPTVQIDGVVWDQAIVGNTVWAGGQFANARPAGAAAGTQLTPRSNLLAYNLTTGALITSIAPSLNAQVKAVAVSPDQTRVYVAGAFTTANGVKHNRIAAYDAATGAIINSFAPNVDATVNAIVATNTTVYVGGIFGTGGGLARPKLAAFNASDGKPTAWAPAADGNVNALTLTPDGSKLIVGGAFKNINSSPAYGLAAVDPVTGALLPWNATTKVRNAGTQSAILSLSTDGTSIIGTGYTYGAGGNLEGTFSADPVTGDVTWVEDCHGDTYDAYSDGSTVYTVSHAHYCGNLGGFFQSNPWAINMRHALAFTANATGTLQHDPLGYFDWFGTPSPSMINWFPDLDTGTYTGKDQAAWSVTGNGQYVVMGGEFPRVNRTGQQGLVRFAVSPIAPSKVGPDVKGGNSNPTVMGLASGAARITWQANSDPDDYTLTYRLTRNGVQIYQADASNSFWNRPTMGFIDAASNLVPGTVYRYRLTATDSDGNTATSDNISFTAPTPTGTNAYTAQVLADGASPYWPMNEAAGTVLFDNSNTFNDADTSAELGRGVTPGAIAGDAATSFVGTATASTRTAIPGPNTFTAQAWFKTTTTQGGKIIGFGNARTGNSSSYDRHVYMDAAGRIWFGVYPNAVATLNSAAGLNDGQWHQVSASLGADGMKLSIDGKLVAQRTDVTSGQAYSGYWRVGGDNTNAWPGAVASNFIGAIDEVAVYPTVLNRQQINAQWVASGRTSTIPAAPSDPYGAAVFNDNPVLFWRLGDSTGTTAKDSGPIGDQTGIYQNGVNLGAAGGIKGTSDTAASFDGADDFVASTNLYSNPRSYSEEAWFKTTSTSGGKIIGFGRNQTGRSSNYDRHIYMSPNGTVTYGIYDGNIRTITTPTALNDGVWHHVVATQSTVDGMKFYVDGVLVGTNPATSPENYDGYWRVGGDNHWGGGSAFLNGTIDDAAVYAGVLTAAQVANHFSLGSTVVPPNQAPVADFTSAATFLDATFTSTSSDPDGSIASYDWNFGDSATSTETNPQHSYPMAGTYTVTLTVTDDQGLTTTISHPITVTAAPVNQAPVASFTATAAQLTANVDAIGSSDPDGTIASYAWDFGDGFTTTGVTASHAYTTGGTKTITLTVTDNQGTTATTSQPIEVVAPPVNQAPVAGFTAAVENLTVNVESTSTDPDGTIASQSWDFGDTTAAVTTAAATHTYAAAGTYTVTLTVVDNAGASRTATRSVSVTAPPPANVAPTARFTSTVNALQVAVDGSASTDSDGTITAYTWNFGDGSTDLVTTATASHTYATAGTYQVTLTITDNSGATNALTSPVTVTSPVATPLVSDTFTRTSASGWGTADIGGAWTITGGASNFSVNGGTGKVRLSAAGSGPSATLGAVTAANVSTSLAFSIDKAPTGAGLYLSVGARKVGNSEYRTTARLLATGVVQLQLSKTVGGVSTTVATSNIAGITYSAGDTLNVTFSVTGSATVALGAKIWKAGTTEPAAWQVTATDASSPLGAGTVALYPYLSGSATNAPVVVTYDNLTVLAVTP